MKYYRLDVSYPFDGDFTHDERIAKLVGLPYTDAGAGFGWRDLGWRFELHAPAETIAERLRAAGYKAVVTEYDE